mmetsp:Transcript_120845/g.385870  ORF Transcript_120845/g.385870 Transcript_120845/m.385870 type:complete len:387 (+) Transcript_120845:690-1850(+)
MRRSMACWSSTFAFLKAEFSAVRSSVKVLICSSTSLMDATVAIFCWVRSSMRPASLSILASFFSIFHSTSLTVLSTFKYSFLHWSRFSMSAVPSLFKVPTMASMATRTFSKWPTLASFTWTASAARRKLLPALADFLSALKALSAGDASLASCTKDGAMSRPVLYLSLAPVSLPSLMAEPKSSRAASLVRISSALPMPANSSSRRLLRVLQSSCLDWHAALVSSKKAMSASRDAVVSSYICCVSARRCSFSAFSPAFFSCSASISFSSVVFVAIKSSKPVFAFASAWVLDSRSVTNVSYMSLRMPWTVKDWGMYLALAPERKYLLKSMTLSDFMDTEAGRASTIAFTFAWADCACNKEEACEPATSTVTACSRAAMACLSSEVSAT